ncbi:oligosaccharide repeat unit polymerase [Marinobacter sp. NFXS11]|uniref:O-antigen polymerase n=1 Tax=Marinobacter sp. NFXS11 TaxID=2818432 RepID=UPI0032DF0B43
MYFDSLRIEAYVYILSFILVASFSLLLGATSGAYPVSSSRNYKASSINYFAIILFLLAFVSTIFNFIKYYNLLSESGFSLSSITDLRLLRARDGDTEIGTGPIGIVATMLSGFSIVAACYKKYFFYQLTRANCRLLSTAFILGVMSSFLSGGRFFVVIALAVIFFFNKVYDRNKFEAKARSKFSGYILFGVALAFVISVFLMREGDISELDKSVLLGALGSKLEGAFVPEYFKYSDSLSGFLVYPYFIFAMLIYYIGHSVFQLDVLIAEPLHVDAPYLLTYQFYPFFAFLNIFGVNSISISEILSQIPNPGTYFTAIGAFYLDFGILGSIVFAALLFFLGGFFWGLSLKISRFTLTLFVSIFLVFIVFSPIVSLLGISVFPSLIVSLFFVLVFGPKSYRVVRS